MKTKPKSFTLLIIISLFLIPSVPFSLINESKSLISTLASPTSLQVNSLIDINGNTDFDQQATDNSWNGNGTAGSPYIIEGYWFNLSGTLDQAAALVQNTDRHFIMRNCSWLAPKPWSVNAGGFKFVNVTNGHIESSLVIGALEPGTLNPARWAVWIEDSINCTINDLNVSAYYYYSDIYPFFYGIDLINSHGINITNCHIEARIDIKSEDSTNLTIMGNDLTGLKEGGDVGGTVDFQIGIQFDNTSYSNLSGNTIYNARDNGIKLLSSSNNNTIIDNTIYDIYGSSGIGWGLLLVDSCNNTVSENAIYEIKKFGIYLIGSSLHNTLSGNAIYQCDWYGIWVTSNNNTLKGNRVYNCSLGIILAPASFNNVSWNKIFNNTGYGMAIDSPNGPASNNQVNWNYFVSNNQGGTSQAFDDQPNNNFSYNYWNELTNPDGPPADGIVDTPYGIDGGSNEDLSPRASPIPLVMINSPNASLYKKSTISVSLSGNAFHYLYYIEGVDTHNQTWTGSVNRTLFDGTYTLHVFGIDPVGYTAYANVTFTIEFLSVISPLNQDYSTDTITVLLSGNALFYWYFIDNIDTLNQTWMVPVNRTLPDGNHILHAYGNDTEGTIIHIIRNFFVDANPPTIEILTPIHPFYTQNSITLTYTVSDITKTDVVIYINDVANTTSIPSGSTSIFQDGDYNITICAMDQVGHVGKTSIIFTVDTTPPTVNIDSPSETTYTSGSVSVTLSGNAESYWYYIEGIDSSNHSWTSTVTRNLPAGTYTLHAYGNDTAGNIAHESVTFTINIATTTTTSDTDIDSTTTTTSESGAFSSFITILFYINALILIIRKRKKN
ncbi:MAG: right-handed parallel beta-helix repeat-containing protein [Candidatus Hodarchaeales archaeon]